MRKFSLLASLLIIAMTAHGEETTLKQDAKQVGHETGAVVHKVGADGKQVGKQVAHTAREVGHATRDAAKQVGHKVAETAVEVGHATRDGAKEFARTVKDGAQSTSSDATVHQHTND